MSESKKWRAKCTVCGSFKRTDLRTARDMALEHTSGEVSAWKDHITSVVEA